MGTITINEINEKAYWEEFLTTHHEANFLQSWEWGDFHASLGKSIQRTGFFDNGQVVGVMLSIVESAKRGKYLTVPGGPLFDWNRRELVQAFVDEIQRIARQNSCVFVRVRPQLEQSPGTQSLFLQLGFRDAPMHLHAELTSQLDLSKTEGELFAGMRKATRYEVRKAMKLGVVIKTSTDLKEIKAFYDLQLETARRHQFVPFSFEFLSKQFEAFISSGKALLYSATHEGFILAQAMIMFYGSEAAYHYGASTSEGRKIPGAYLIQWEAIREAKKRGMKRYNFWGVAPEDQTTHRFYGVSVFKRGFGGYDFEYLHAKDFVVNKPLYMINVAVEEIRKKIRHL